MAITYQDLFEQHHNTDARYLSATNAWVDIGVWCSESTGRIFGLGNREYTDVDDDGHGIFG